MSDSGGLNSLNNQILVTDKPYVWVFIPLAVFLTVGIAVTCCQFRRRQRKVRALELHRDGSRALEQDLEALGGDAGGAAPTTGPAVRSSRWQRLAAQTERERRLARAEDGLNELGEAPPPYDPKAGGRNGVVVLAGPGVPGAADTELRELPPALLRTPTSGSAGSDRTAAVAPTRTGTTATAAASPALLAASVSANDRLSTATSATTATAVSTGEVDSDGESTATTAASRRELHSQLQAPTDGPLLPPAYSERPTSGDDGLSRPPAAVLAQHS